MPNARELPDPGEFSERFRQVMDSNGYGEHGGSTRLAEEYGVKAPVVSAWRAGRHLPSPAKVLQMAKSWSVEFDWLYWGRGIAPSFDFSEQQRPPDQRSQALITNQLENDIDALRYAVSALFATVAIERPVEAGRIADALRSEEGRVPEKYLSNGLLERLLVVLDKGAAKSKTRRGAPSA